MGREGTEPPFLPGRGGRWRLGQPSLHQSVSLAVVTGDKCPHLCEASAETVKGSIKIKMDRKIQVIDSFSTGDQKKH